MLNDCLDRYIFVQISENKITTKVKIYYVFKFELDSNVCDVNILNN